jgi:hypothetical protein
MKRNPKTPAEWQEAVDAAAACRAIADCKMYGLIQGGPEINVERCDEILERGKARGLHPSAPSTELAIRYVAAFNDASKKQHVIKSLLSDPHPEGG